MIISLLRSPTYIYRILRSDRDLRRFQTVAKWKTQNPEFNEEFVFDSKLKELPRRTLEISVWGNDSGLREDCLGGVQIGIDSKGERLRHWFEAIKHPDIRHDRWHFLLNDGVA
ncbi:unnamed protein product [Notodromas monacha]|uniref:C2 domain-containing protein n=1 Tax=Notodromas monacha TaxID=399045 RepID=A0A7R9BYY9_9CRUS|nr:unnamed protein product [Notodromas monacha]CAG0923267.1 unnamed protein product [Notodromas monacha]